MTYITQLTSRKAMFSSRILTLVFAGLLFIVLQPSAIQAQWSTTGNNISNTNTGNVGIGTTSPPAYKLDVIAPNPWVARFRKTDATNGGIIIDAAAGYNPSLAFSVNGTFKWYLNNITTGGDSLQFWESTGTFPRFTFTQAGNLGIGTTSPTAPFSVASNTGGTNNTLAVFDTANDNGLTFPNLIFQRSRGTLTSRTAVQLGDRLGGLAFRGYGATGFNLNNDNAAVRAYAAENFTDTAQGTYLTLETTTSGTAFRSEKVRILASGNVGINSTNPVFDANGGRYLTLDGGSGFISSIGTAGGTNSAGTTVGQVAFINSNLGTTDKRVATIVGATDTATNSGTLDFYTANAGTWFPRLRINSSGNIGVGTTSPGFRFDVQGGQLNASGGLCIAGDCKTAWSQVGGGGSSQWTTGAGSVIYYNTANVGIGTATPGSKLFVGSGTPAVSTLPGLNVALGGNSYVSTSDGIVNTFIGADTSLYGIVGTLSNHPLGLRANNTLAVTVLPGGSVGIGTASPTAQLHVAGANGLANNTAAPAPDALKVVGGIGGNGTWGASQGGVGGGMSFAGGTGGTPVAGSQSALGGKGGSISLVGGGGGPNVFAVGGGAGGDVSINGGAGVANSDGNISLADLRGKVGIGTASPGTVLEVRKDQNVSTDIYLNNATAGSGTGAYTGLRFYQGTTLKAFVGSANSGSSGYTGGANALQIWNMQNAPMVFGTNGLERVRIDAAGNVGIGTTPNSSYKLDVAGSINVSGNINAKYQDMAEWVESSQVLTPGTVVVLDQTKSNQVIASSQAYDTRVAGVISLQPGITLGEKGDTKVLVATTGRVRIKVDASRGSIQVGDLLVTSGVSGLAMKSQPIDVGGVQLHRPGTLIGKALEPLEQGVGEILVLLSLQ